MSVQLSTAVRNARLDAIESTIGTAPILKIRTGPPPANCAASRTGTVLATLTLPSDWMAAASGGAKALSGTWEDASADADGRAAHFEILDSGGSTCHAQGIVAMAWQASTAVSVGDYFTNDSGKLYVCSSAGTTASSGGPTGTSTGITDGTAEWDYVQAAADMAINNAIVASSQIFAVTAFTLTDGNA